MAGFIQQLAVCYVGRGYWFYVVGHIAEGKDLSAVDLKLISRYRISISKWTRYKHRRQGAAGVQYIRYRRTFVLLATHGDHAFFDGERASIRDARRAPIRALGYSISYKASHAHVRIEQEEYRALRAHFLSLAVHRQAEFLEAEFRALPYEPYAPVRRQLWSIWRHVNQARAEAGFRLVSPDCLPSHRKPVRPFE